MTRMRTGVCLAVWIGLLALVSCCLSGCDSKQSDLLENPIPQRRHLTRRRADRNPTVGGRTSDREVVGEDRKDLLAGLVDIAVPGTRILLNFSSVVLSQTIVPKDVVITAIKGVRPALQCPSSGRPAFIIRSGEVKISGLRIENCTHSAVTIGPTQKPNNNVSFIDMEFVNNSERLDGGAILIGVNAFVHIENSTFKNNSADRGGAIFSTQSTVDIVNSSFLNNSGRLDGGAVHSQDFATSDTEPNLNSLKIVNCSFTLNKALRSLRDPLGLSNELGAPLEFSQFLPLLHSSPSGGAIFVNGFELVQIAESNFHQNSATAGGAIHIADNTAVKIQQSNFIDNFLIENNQAKQNGSDPIDERMVNGGAVYASMTKKSTLTFDRSVFELNTAVYGGAVHVVGPEFTQLNIQECEFNGNRAKVVGGALLIRNINDVEISGITVKNNRGQTGGGLVLTNGASGTITMGSFFEGNRAIDGGAAAFFGAGQVQIQDAIFQDNIAERTGGAASLIESIVRGRIGFSDTIFKGNKALRGGAIFSDSVAELDFRLVNKFSNNSALSGGALLVQFQNRVSNQFLSFQAVFESNVAGKSVCNKMNLAGESALDCEKKDGEFVHLGHSCGVGEGGAICLLLDALPDRSAAVIQLRDGLFARNKADIGGALNIQMDGNEWVATCPTPSPPLQSNPCRTINLVNLEFEENVAMEASPDIFTNDASSVYIAINAAAIGTPAFVSLEDYRKA